MADGGGGSGGYAIRRKREWRMKTEIKPTAWTDANQEDDDQTNGDERVVVDIESLISAANEAAKPPQAGSNARILPKVPAWMREFPQFSNEHFDPEVVALGPFHHDQSRLNKFEKIKVSAFRKFVDLLAGEGRDDPNTRSAAVEILWEAVAKEVNDKELLQCYPKKDTRNLSEEAFTCMMALDGCFILHFIDCANRNKIVSNISEHQVPLVVRDMFLLENQIPFAVLRALSQVMYGTEDAIREKIFRFIHTRILFPSFYTSAGRWWVGRSWLNSERSLQLPAAEWNAVTHLLDVLRRFVLGKPKGQDRDTIEKKRKDTQPPPLHMFGSVVELKDAGIRFTNSEENHLTEIDFKENWCFPEVLVPPIVITRTTICFILNMVALEQYLESPSDRTITSYTSFLNSVINHAEDVKELRLRRVLYHGLGSDEEVAELFNHWPIDAMGGLHVHRVVSRYIAHHRSKPWKKSIAEFYYDHFRSPWSIISLAAGVVLLLLTFLQTIFTIKQSSDSSAMPPPPPLM